MNLVDCLSSLNKWWRTGRVDDTYLFKRIRSEFSIFVKNLGSEKLFAVTGPKGCGKTTLFYHTVDYLLKMNTKPSRIIMFAGDEPSLFIHNVGLADILKSYATAVLEEELDSLTAPVYVFIDEIHRLKNWRQTVKRFQDRNAKLRFIISAPTKELIFPQGSEELLNRSNTVNILPLSPQQFIEFFGAYKRTGFDNITYKSLMPRRALFENPREYVSALLGNIHSLTNFRAEKMDLMGEYILSGGYPGYFSCDNLAAWHKKLIDEIIDQSIYNDILSNYTIKSPEKFKLLLYYIASENGREQAYAQIGKTLSLNTVTIINHINMLKESGLLTVCENYSGKKFGVSRKNKRIYLYDSGIKTALLRRNDINPANLEDELRQVCISMGAEFTEKNGGTSYFWRNNNSEVDLVLDKGYTLLPVSVMLRNNLSRRDLRGLNSFGRTYFNRDSVVITRDSLAIENNVYYLPYWLI